MKEQLFHTKSNVDHGKTVLFQLENINFVTIPR